MESVGRMIDRARQVCPSKAELARRLGVTRQRLHEWETGSRPMPDEKIAELASVASVPLIEALGTYHAEALRKKRAGVTAGLALWACGLVAVMGALWPFETAARGTEKHGACLQLRADYRRFVVWLLQQLGASFGPGSSPFGACHPTRPLH